jgi:hypothetical protein
LAIEITGTGYLHRTAWKEEKNAGYWPLAASFVMLNFVNVSLLLRDSDEH